MDGLQTIGVGLAIAVAGGLPTIWATKRWGTRRGKIQIHVSRTSLLLMSGTFRSDIEVRAAGHVLAEPTLYTIVITNTGPRDLASQHFDDGRPISAKVPGRVAAARWMSTGQSPTITGDDKTALISWTPALLPRKEFWKLHILVDLAEKATMEFTNPLIDFDVTYTGGGDTILGPGFEHG
ncbi:hypothetical protein ACFCV3_28865 [Kribbella sp. NPDC056345]|uniref:hypothetical protein n=1 Tax=Kribbella sp. NPDC056345 TaxID=3345789 RepID=UPI0035DAE0C9